MPSLSRVLLAIVPVALVAAFGIMAYDGLVKGEDPAPGLRPVRGGEYHLALPNDPPTLDPAHTTDATSVTCVLQMFDGLVRFEGSRDPAVAPAIAESWEIAPDQRTYKFRLRRAVRFHSRRGDGRPTANRGRVVTADDVRYSFERVLDPATRSPRSSLFEVVEGAAEFRAGRSPHVSGLVVVDDHALEIRLSRPYAPFLVTLTMPNAFIVAKEDVAELDAELLRRRAELVKRGARAEEIEALELEMRRRPLPGTGPFVFERYVQNRELSMVAHHDYFEGRANLDRVVMHVQPDEEKRFQAFLNGELHHSAVPDPYYTMVKDRTSPLAPHFTEVSELGVYYYGMNVGIEPFKDPLVRQAIARAIDKEAIRRHVKSERVQVAHAPLPPDLKIHLRGPAPYTYDPRAAGDLLARAGYPIDPATGTRRGLAPIPIQIPEGDEHMRIARAVQANLADVGVATFPVARPWKEHLETLRKGNVPFFRLGWVADYKDADNFLYYNFHSRNVGTSNFTAYSTPRVDRLLDLARENTDPSYRNQLYEEAQRIIVDDSVWVCLFYFSTAIVRQPHVKGTNLTSFGEHMIRLHEVWLQPRPGA